eukprot:CAMPEP_0206248174 /NCGR_PEP_ID=MMETSP0047_2-20121206/20227_1 /ASSEMBLY_ACC=CAM_ASM_000192 /TAXON_ID=195065 /ORGANISM="Chroomonas mesostigmatica_cf, Strain CCMP1168" /LENGTH=102 /DNA_ID=CAMNT_0053673797 /DNA_START=274 /DNA_END=578 /DNA_ORIENTATION=+
MPSSQAIEQDPPLPNNPEAQADASLIETASHPIGDIRPEIPVLVDLAILVIRSVAERHLDVITVRVQVRLHAHEVQSRWPEELRLQEHLRLQANAKHCPDWR